MKTVFLTIEDPWAVAPGATAGYSFYVKRKGSIAGVRGVPKSLDVQSLKIGHVEFVLYGTALRVVGKAIAFGLHGSDVDAGAVVSIELHNPTDAPVSVDGMSVEAIEDRGGEP